MQVLRFLRFTRTHTLLVEIPGTVYLSIFIHRQPENRIKYTVPRTHLAEYQLLKSIPGIGEILASTIWLEIGDINRFNSPGNFASYCRCVNSRRESNGKKEGENNRKNENKYLAWAFIEAANFCVRRCEPARRFYEKKTVARNNIVATKALAHKLYRACYWVIKNREPFELAKLF